METTAWHSLSVAETEQLTRARPSGLTTDEATNRGSGVNRITERGRPPLARILAGQFLDPLVLVLLVAALLSTLVTEELVQGAVILVLVLINAALGGSQEWRAAKSVDALRETASPTTAVRRDGRVVRIPTIEVVVGDLVQLDAGDRVSADLRLVEAVDLEVDESSLTGESTNVQKSTHRIAHETGLSDRTCMAFTSTLVRRGRGTGVVVAIGDDTELGRIAQYTARASRPPTPLQRQLARLGAVAGIAVGLLSAALVAVGLSQGRPLIELVMLGVALAVSAIPEGLVAIAAIVLASGVRRMAERRAIIRTLPTVETLGSVDVICVDKTGTLTQNRMRVVDFWQPVAAQQPASDLLAAASSCNDAATSASGDPFEIALLEWASEHGAAALPRHAELAFDPQRRRMSTAHALVGDRLQVFTKGGFDEVLAECRPDGAHASARRVHDRMAARGLRVVAFAQRTVAADLPRTAWESDLALLGLVGLEDPLREGAAEAVARAARAGISVVMVTGDHALTAETIADQVGLRRGRPTITGAEVDDLTDTEMRDRAAEAGVFARVAPSTKMRIVRALQAGDAVVAMTGDGVNDGPALAAADVGCAMGRSGTDVAREAADLVITDDHLGTIVDAVAEGRRIHDNLTKVVEFLLTTNAGEVLLIVGSVIAGLATPLSPAHILIVNLLTDGGPALALAADPPSRGLMTRPPRRHSLLTRGAMRRIAYQGALFAGAAMLSFFAAGGEGDLDRARTATFLTLALSQVVHAFSVRTPGGAFSRTGRRNSRLNVVAVITTAAMVAVIYVPGVNDALALRPLSLLELGIATAIAVIPFGIVELIKAWSRPGNRRDGRDRKSPG